MNVKEKSYRYLEYIEMCTEIVIRRAKKDDMEAVSQMITELSAYHKSNEMPKKNLRDLQIDGFENETPAFVCIVAERKMAKKMSIVGYALYYPIYSSREGRSLMLEDIYVKAHERNHGIGILLFNALVKEAYSTGCGGVNFHVVGWNPARPWYERQGAVDLTGRDGRCLWRLSGAALQAAADARNK